MLDLEAINPLLDTRDPREIVAWAAAEFGDDLLLSSSFGAESAVMIHLATSVLPKIRVVFVDTQFLFAETHAFVETLRRRFDLDLRVYRPSHDGAAYLREAGEVNADERFDVARCCAVNKNEPFDRAMRELRPKAWLRGIRRDQAATRRDRSVVELSKRFDCYAVSPLLNWRAREVHGYMKEHDLPYHPLYERGYASIGCSPHTCTRPIQIGEDTRAGRWSGSTKTECGLHL
jgi:phosphoadenosine phosphosulfate reductase